MHATIPNGNVGYDQYTVPDDCSCRTYFCCFPLALANIYPWPLVLFFQISLKNSELKTTHNSTYRDCRVHFFRHRFSKWLYTKPVNPLSETAFLWNRSPDWFRAPSTRIRVKKEEVSKHVWIRVHVPLTKHGLFHSSLNDGKIVPRRC